MSAAPTVVGKLKAELLVASEVRLILQNELEQAQARVKLLYGVATAVKTGLAHSHRELGAECGEAPCTLCWLHGTAEEALAAFAEGE